MTHPATDPLRRYTPLDQLFVSAREPATATCLSRDGQLLSWQDWCQQVADWRQYFSQRPEQRWALYDRDSGRFAAILFALISLDKTVCLPGSAQADVLEQLAAQIDGLVADIPATDCPSGLRFVPCQMSLPPAGISELCSQPLNQERASIEVFTSGSTGEPQVISKTLRQLSQEIDHQHQLWSHRTPQLAHSASALICGTVSHQHIYGLLFRICWPLAAGWCLDAYTCQYLEELQHRQLPDSPRLLISSPTHLSRLPEQLASAVSHSLLAVYSSGAPLAQADSLLAQRRLGCEVREIFGSSETGGIAWRIQRAGPDARWQALPGVRLQQAADTQCLQARSAHIGNEAEEADWYTTADRVQLEEDGLFTLSGRIDRIVKVEGKRLSLDEMEQYLRQQPWIEQAHLLLLSGRRTEIGAVIRLNQAGQQQLQQTGRHGFNQRLKQHLLCRFERPTLPRRWRYLEHMPVNAQGKLQRQTLLELFMNAERPRWPQLHTELPDTPASDVDTSHQLTLTIPEDLLYFDGHFDQTPILPGVVQVHWAEHYARRLFGLDSDFQRLEVVKFQQVVRPGQALTLELAYQPAAAKVSFAYRSAVGQHASGRLVFTPTALTAPETTAL